MSDESLALSRRTETNSAGLPVGSVIEPIIFWEKAFEREIRRQRVSKDERVIASNFRFKSRMSDEFLKEAFFSGRLQRGEIFID